MLSPLVAVIYITTMSIACSTSGHTAADALGVTSSLRHGGLQGKERDGSVALHIATTLGEAAASPLTPHHTLISSRLVEISST